ncbi:importin subunit alpha-4-like isoform X1 [Anneissia japonica]|uniref:importin subunit alpha-4-like isoform X1 n=1 Tax=Anneissia japonica TaxID=1529436 RepID=UPI0014259F74|nr:importin subunit alpha-4-like isoform X1 [Anneissia japonica]
MDRKTFYKHTASDVTELREKKREEETVLRKQKREKLVLCKRARHSEEDLALVDSSFTVKQVEDIGKLIQEESNDCLSLLKQLKNAFAEDMVNIDIFLSVNGALHSLIGLLTGDDPGLQLEASWCITNLAAGNQHHSSLALKHAAPYLITFLQGHNAPLQDQCCWALGNIAGDGPEFREILIKQGAIHPLICLLQPLLKNTRSNRTANKRTWESPNWFAPCACKQLRLKIEP